MKKSLFFLLAFFIFCQNILSQDKQVLSSKKLDLGWNTNMMIISPDNETIAIVCDNGSSNSDGFITLLKTKNLGETQRIIIKNDKVKYANFSYDGKTLFYCTSTTFYIYDIKSKSTKKIEFQNGTSLNSFDISPDGNFLAITDSQWFRKSLLLVYDLSTLRLVYSKIIEATTGSIKYFNRGDRLALGCKGKLKIINTKNGEIITELKSRLYANSFSRDFIITDNDSVLICTEGVNESRNFYYWDMKDYNLLQTVPFQPIYNIESTPDKKIIAIMSANLSFSGSKGKIQFLDIESNKVSIINELEDIGYIPEDLILVSPNYEYIYWIGDATLGWSVINYYKLKNISKRSELYMKKFDQYWAEISNAYKYFNPRGEFETLDEYRSRANSFCVSLYEIKKKYLDGIEYELNIMSDQSKQRMLETETKIYESIRDTVIKIDNVGMYDVENETFPISIMGRTEIVKIQRSEAESFKQNYKSALVNAKKKLKYDLKTYETFNIVIHHPILGIKYFFGEQKNN